MIKSIKINNFLSFRNTDVHLNKNQNVLIGINGSGKSNFLKAIKLLKEGVIGVGLKKHVIDNLGGFDNIFFKGSGNNNSHEISLEFILDGQEMTNANYGFHFTDDIVYSIALFKAPSGQNFYVKERIATDRGYVYLDFDNGNGVLNEPEVNFNGNGRNGKKKQVLKRYTFDAQELALREVRESDADRYYQLSTIKKAIKDIIVYDYFDTTPRSAIRKPMLPTSERKLSADGTNLPQILNTIKINYRPSYRKITDMLTEVNPNFEGFSFNMIGGNIELMLDERLLDSSIHVSSISDGTLRFLCLLAILFNPDRGKFVCIDEPEVGLHPDMISNIANAIKEASETSTILVSTHSENLLNYFEIEDARVFEKSDDNSTQINQYQQSQFEGWYEEFSLGLMWKQGDIGGVRYGA